MSSNRSYNTWWAKNKCLNVCDYVSRSLKDDLDEAGIKSQGIFCVGLKIKPNSNYLKAASKLLPLKEAAKLKTLDAKEKAAFIMTCATHVVLKVNSTYIDLTAAQFGYTDTQIRYLTKQELETEWSIILPISKINFEPTGYGEAPRYKGKSVYSYIQDNL